MSTADRPARIWKTADGRYVGDGHRDAELLAAGPADPTPDDFDAATFEPGPNLAPVPEADVEDVEPEPEPEKPAEPAPEPEKPADKATSKRTKSA